MADDLTAQEMEERSRRCMSYMSGAQGCSDTDYEKWKNSIPRLGEIRSDWKAWVLPVFKGMTFDTISARHHKFTTAWKASATYHACYEAIEETVFRQEKLNITSCMCLGLGSFTGIMPKGEVDFRARSLSQLVAFEGWIDQLKTKFDIKHIYFQEPHFSVLDKKFLRSRGYEILHTPESDTYMSETTFLFNRGVNSNVQESSLASAFPALYINYDLSVDLGPWLHPPWGPNMEKRQEEEKLPNSEYNIGRMELIKSFLDQRAIRALPETSELAGWFFSMLIYYKPDSEADIRNLDIKPHEGITYTYGEAMKIFSDKGYLEQLEDLFGAEFWKPRRSEASASDYEEGEGVSYHWPGSEDEDDSRHSEVSAGTNQDSNTDRQISHSPRTGFPESMPKSEDGMSSSPGSASLDNLDKEQLPRPKFELGDCVVLKSSALKSSATNDGHTSPPTESLQSTKITEPQQDDKTQADADATKA